VDRAAALALLRRYAATLGSELSADERERVRELYEQALEALEGQRPRTRAVRNRVAELERQLAHLPAGERAAAIRERLSLTRRTYYRLRPRKSASS
jgi:DNA-binding SARP family transcriptional activator